MIKNNTEFIFNDTPTKSNPIMNQKWVKRIDEYANYAKEYILHYF